MTSAADHKPRVRSALEPRSLLRIPALMLVTDEPRLRGRSLEDVARSAVLGGVTAVQLREKERSHSAVVTIASRLRDAIASDATLFVNSDIDAAFVLSSSGVHLPEDGASIADARARLGPDVLISRAVHSVEAAIRADHDGADIVQLGTVFETASKPGRAGIGLDGVRAVCASVRVPVIAIGGINASNAGDVIRAGASGVAVIGAILDADDPCAAAAALREAIDAAFAAGRSSCA
jgi:thiamine-phosphate pyrophosphorylase